MWKTIFLIIGLVALMLAPVNSQSVSLGPQIGYHKAQDADEGNLMYGAAWRFKFTPMFGLEGSINYRHESYFDDALTVRNWPVMVTGLIFPIPNVYAGIGVGWYSITYDYDQSRFSFLEDETSQKFGWHFGGGVEVPIAPMFKLTADIRYVFLDYDFKEIPGSADLSSDFYIITAGFLFRL